MKSPHGFSLIEMAFVLVIVTLLLGGLLVPFATQVEQKRIAETQKAMDEIKEALIGYALSHRATTPSASGTLQPYLPCPDLTALPANPVCVFNGTANDGQEDRCTSSGVCVNQEGNLPWATLGVSPADAWGNRLHYRVDSNFSSNSITHPGFGLRSPANEITVCTTAPIPASGNCPSAQQLATGVPAIVLSYGKNGYGALNSNGSFYKAPPTMNTDEIQNQASAATATTPTTHVFVSRSVSPASTPCGGSKQPLCEFDDLLTWLSPHVLFNRMVAADQLP